MCGCSCCNPAVPVSNYILAKYALRTPPCQKFLLCGLSKDWAILDRTVIPPQGHRIRRVRLDGGQTITPAMSPYLVVVEADSYGSALVFSSVVYTSVGIIMVLHL